MLMGAAQMETLLERAPSVSLDPNRTLNLGRVKWLQFTYEIPGDRQALLPRILRPTSPPILTLQLWQGEGGDVGCFGLAQSRVSCRAGMRIRTFLLQSVIEGAEAAAVLQSQFGYCAAPGTVTIQQRADKILAEVHSEGRCVLAGSLTSPQSLDANTLQHIENMHVVRTSDGPRLIQVEPSVTTYSVLRGPTTLNAFDAEFWGLPDRELRHAVIGTSAATEISLPPIRHVQRIEPERQS